MCIVCGKHYVGETSTPLSVEIKKKHKDYIKSREFEKMLLATNKTFRINPLLLPLQSLKPFFCSL